MQNRIAELKDRLRIALDLNHKRPVDLSKDLKISKSAISQYLSGRSKDMPSERLYYICQYLNVSEAWLMGFDVPMERVPAVPAIPNCSNVYPISTQSLPVLGKIACGEPIYMNEEKEVYTQKGTKIRADYIVIAKGDSMTGARINDGDIVFIRRQPTVENGEIAAVAIGDTATLKRFYYYREQSMIILRACNPAYEDLVYVGEALEEVKVLGKAVCFQSDVR